LAVVNYKDLQAWRLGIQLVKEVYRVTCKWPDKEVFGLTSQARRSAVSIPANIAEGQGRKTTKDFLRHLSIAYGSLMELETHLVIAAELSYLSREQFKALELKTVELAKVLSGLTRSLTSKPVKRV
jgi:four helix bundle protein